MSEQEPKPQVDLPGYELIEKIGAGGYGEVWSAIAPGGMRKAVKFVFGDQFDKRATSELSALEKVKAVRHPFLLSLEQIQVVEGRLVVVSELADASLRDRFVECVEQGLPGIPRDELLGYLADASDALDYLGEKHDLAHLDIKPENLLLVAGHVKVADFGLVKSLNNQSQASLVGGMTPTYAAPEVFRGAPSRQSDQYSLAIRYQEMLTGSVPFPGVNAAELTLQHMKDDPDVSRLPEADRFPAARALSKDPSNRYETCRTLVEAIRQTKQHAHPSNPFEEGSRPDSSPGLPPLTAQQKLNRHSVTEVFEEPSTAKPTDEGDSLRIAAAPLDQPEPELASLPELPEADAGFQAAPAVFIGVGGTGARVLRSLRSQIREHLGIDSPLAAAPMLLLDTDPQTLSTTTGPRGLDANETVALPLRRPQAYRDKADLLLRWLGRRWLYNIPRTLRTEGIRPLGRLALVDHARQAFQRIRGVLMSAVEESSRQDSADEVGLSFDQPGVRVYVIGSASGAVGSGMSLDIAYAVRSILDRLGVEASTILGIMTHSTRREATRGELARVNAYAWLSEFQQHRASAEGYPGDAGIGLPAHAPGVPAFDHTYFVPMGEQIDTPDFESAADAIAEYLFADAFTPSQRLLDACRNESGGAATLRSFAVRHRDGQSESPLGPIERVAIGRMIDRWLGGEDPLASAPSAEKTTDQVVHGAVAFLGRTQLDSSTLASNCRSLLEASLGGDATAFVDARFVSRPTNDTAQVAAIIDECFGVDESRPTPTQIDGKPIAELVGPIAQRLSDEMSTWVLERINDTQERLDGAARASAWLQDHLNAIDNDLDKLKTSILADRDRWLGANHDEPAAKARVRLFRLGLDEASLVAARQLVTLLRERLEELPETLGGLRGVVGELRERLGVAVPAETGGVSTEEAHSLAVEIEKRLQNDYLTAHGGLLGSLSEHDAVEQLHSTVRHAARVVMRDRPGSSRAAADAALTAGFAEPPLADAGGVYRRLTLSQPTAQRESGAETSAEDELLLVTEMADASLSHVAGAVINGRRDYAAFAERVRTRRDIAWIDAITGGVRPSADAATPCPTPSFDASDAPPAQTAVLS